MQKSRTGRYWLFQIAGWGSFIAFNVFLAVFIANRFNEKALLRIFFYVEVGLLFSHLMRELIRSTDLLMRNIRTQLIIFALIIIIFSLMAATANTLFEYRFALRPKDPSYKELLYLNFGAYLPVITIWNFIYFMYHFMAKTRKQQIDTIKLEALVRNLELKTIKAHINPHFIFNSLNSIRALIDENPSRARQAITELSNILRNSLSVDKRETVSLRDELKIVKDYLALENMRFEDRLRVEYEVDFQTLELQIPPMMLQTLVENAIKHGISKEMKGGAVKISSEIVDGQHEIVVCNTGQLRPSSSGGGFGVSSTHDRLDLLYGGKAKFQIRQLENNFVEAKILLPVPINSTANESNNN